MAEVLIPMSGVNANVFLSKQEYKIPNIAQNMFSAPKEMKSFARMLPSTVLRGLTLQRLWDNGFADTSDFLKRYHDTRNETNFKVSQWQYASDMGSGYRFTSLTTTVDVPFKGTKTQLNEAHRFAFTTTESGGLLLLYQVSSQTPNVISGTSFRPEASLFFTAESATSQCSVEILGNCKSMSMVFSTIRGVAVPRAIREMSEAYTAMVRMLSTELCGEEVAIAASEGGGAKPSATAALPGGGDVNESSMTGDESPGMAFQGVLLVLAFFITLVLLWSMSTIRRTSHQTVAFMRSMSEQAPRRQGAVKGSGAGSGGGVLSTLTEDQALLHAAREAEIQTLRYRWREQQRELATLEKSVNWLWWMGWAQVVGLVCLCIKMFM